MPAQQWSAAANHPGRRRPILLGGDPSCAMGPHLGRRERSASPRPHMARGPHPTGTPRAVPCSATPSLLPPSHERMDGSTGGCWVQDGRVAAGRREADWPVK
uniref:Uncharacterized protein n=1 Tax=Arundo donax TaxID=35708 RepID=A0A0A9BGZ3_ARUDO